MDLLRGADANDQTRLAHLPRYGLGAHAVDFRNRPSSDGAARLDGLARFVLHRSRQLLDQWRHC